MDAGSIVPITGFANSIVATGALLSPIKAPTSKKILPYFVKN